MLDQVDGETGEVTPIDDEAGPDVEFEIPPHLNLETLSGDIRDAMLSRFRLLVKPWEMMTADQQTDVVNGLELAAKQLVRETVRAFSAHEFPHVVVKLGDVKIMGGDKGIEGKITAMNIDVNRQVLGENVGEWVTVYMVNSDQFMGERRRPDIKPDQGDLPLGEDDAQGDEPEDTETAEQE